MTLSDTGEANIYVSMKNGDLMKDPFYAKIMLGIESLIHDHDQLSDGRLTDSDAKSSIRKALSMLKGKPLITSPKNERDRMKGALSIALVDNFEGDGRDVEITKGDYVKALLAVEDSLKTRREYHGHPRGYLDFLVDFIAQARPQ